MSWMTVKVVKTRGVEEFWPCVEFGLFADWCDPQATSEKIAADEPAVRKASADLRVKRGLWAMNGGLLAGVQLFL